MINFHDTSAVDWLLPALMVATWLVLWAVRRGVGGRFFAIAIGLVVLCLPLGLAVSTLGANCPRPVPPGCMSTYTWVLFMNGFLGMYCWVVLLILIFAGAAGAVPGSSRAPGPRGIGTRRASALTISMRSIARELSA